ncbi:hypothetical protein [Streptomyces sp. HPF1205]|nr:hypothetical protein [Streptomyces sp. HPF1205]
MVQAPPRRPGRSVQLRWAGVTVIAMARVDIARVQAEAGRKQAR